MVAFSRKDHLALPWDLIRLQYENTDVSIRKLALLHGLSSKTILLRKIKGEGWTRHGGANAKHLLQIPGIGSAPIPEVEREGSKERVDPQSRRDEEAAATILTAQALAALQSARIGHQMALAEKIQETGRAILCHLLGVLTGDEDKVGEHIKRLIAVRPNGEKITGLLKSAVEAIERGVSIERRALGMDAVNGVVLKADAPAATAYSSEAAIAIVKKLDVTLGLRLRAFTLATLEARRDCRFAG
jgi:hypothetical protein